MKEVASREEGAVGSRVVVLPTRRYATATNHTCTRLLATTPTGCDSRGRSDPGVGYLVEGGGGASAALVARLVEGGASVVKVSADHV